jgi:hypothetical protein
MPGGLLSSSPSEVVYSLPMASKKSSESVSVPIWAVVLCGTGLLMAIGWYFGSYVPFLVRSDVQAETGPINKRLDKVETDLQLFLPRNIPDALMRLPDVLKNAGTDPGKLSTALQQSAQLLRNQHLYTSVDLVSGVGTALLGTPNAPPISQIRDVAVSAAVNYRSFLTLEQIPNTSEVKPVPNPREFHAFWYARQMPGVTAAEEKLFFDPHLVSGPEAAILTDIGKEYESATGPRYFVLDAPGRELSLDGQHWRNVIVRNARIVYRGGAVILENVYFANCTFDIEKSDRGTSLLTNILATPEVTFKVS